MISPIWRIKEKERIKERRNRCYNDKCLAYIGAKLKTKVQGFGDIYIGYSKPKQ
jgi:hypothetical protein